METNILAASVPLTSENALVSQPLSKLTQIIILVNTSYTYT